MCYYSNYIDGKVGLVSLRLVKVWSSLSFANSLFPFSLTDHLTCYFLAAVFVQSSYCCLIDRGCQSVANSHYFSASLVIFDSSLATTVPGIR